MELEFFDLYWAIVAVVALFLYLVFRSRYRQPGEQLTHMIERRGRTYFFMVVLALFILNIFYYNNIISEKLYIMPFVMLGFGMSAPILSLRVFVWDVIVGFLWYMGAIVTVLSPTLILWQFIIFACLLFTCALLYSIKFHRESIH